MKMDWIPTQTGQMPEKEGWYLIKRTNCHPQMAFWFCEPPYNQQWSLCAEYGRCVPKDVVGWVEIEN
jgi:hypothetical protein